MKKLIKKSDIQEWSHYLLTSFFLSLFLSAKEDLKDQSYYF